MDQDEELPTYTPRRAPTEPPSYTPYVQHSEGSHELDPITQETLLSSLSPPSRAYLHRIDTVITTEPKGDEAVPPGKDDAYEQHYTEPSRLYDQTYHEERRRNPKGWRRCPMKRYLCITITVLALVITGVVLFVHYRNTEDSKRNRSVTSHPIPRSLPLSQKLAYLASKLLNRPIDKSYHLQPLIRIRSRRLLIRYHYLSCISLNHKLHLVLYLRLPIFQYKHTTHLRLFRLQDIHSHRLCQRWYGACTHQDYRSGTEHLEQSLLC